MKDEDMKRGEISYKLQDSELGYSVVQDLLDHQEIEPDTHLEVEVWEFKGVRKIQTYLDDNGYLDYHILEHEDGRPNDGG